MRQLIRFGSAGQVYRPGELIAPRRPRYPDPPPPPEPEPLAAAPTGRGKARKKKEAEDA